jgi:hypothetical protein
MTAPNVPTTPAKPHERGASSTGSQRDRRWTDTFFDDYRHPRFPNGRPFTGEREFKSGVSEQSVTAGFLQSDLQCGEYFCENPDQGQTALERQMTLESAWVAPFLLPGGKKYMQFNYAKKRITWRYDAFIMDEKAGLARYWEAAAKAAGESDVIDPRRPDAVPFRIRTLLGSPRTFMNKIRLAQACQAGDPWIMGAVPEPNEELAKLLGYGEISYFGGLEYGDKDFVTVPTAKTPEPIMTPEQVLAVPMDKVQEMITAAIAQHEAQKKAEHAAKSAAGKAKKAEKAA